MNNFLFTRGIRAMMINQAGLCFFLICFLIMLLSSASSTATVLCKYDYNVLVLTWPRSFCETMKDVRNTCKEESAKLPPVFTVHGLWPGLLNGTMIDPSTTPGCSEAKLSFQNLPAEVQSQANQAWPDLVHYCKKQTKAVEVFNGLFWQGEWLKHGSCSNLNPTGYVELVLSLYGPLLPAINRVIQNLPTPRNVIDPATFTKRIRDAAGVVPRLMCQNLTNTPPYAQYLVELQFNVTNAPPYVLQNMQKPTNCVSTRPVRFPQ